MSKKVLNTLAVVALLLPMPFLFTALSSEPSNKRGGNWWELPSMMVVGAGSLAGYAFLKLKADESST